MTKIISTWKELSELPPSETPYLEIEPEDGNGWIMGKRGHDNQGTYLSTHTFYRSTHEWSTAKLRSCGFDVQLKNWGE